MRNVLYAILISVVLVFIGWLALKQQEKKQECLDNGGWINEYNCGEHGCSSWSCVEK